MSTKNEEGSINSNISGSEHTILFVRLLFIFLYIIKSRWSNPVAEEWELSTLMIFCPQKWTTKLLFSSMFLSESIIFGTVLNGLLKTRNLAFDFGSCQLFNLEETSFEGT